VGSRSTKLVFESPFGGPIAHGFLTISLFPKVRPGGGFEIVGARAREGGTVIAHDVEVRVVGSESLAMVCRPLVIDMRPFAEAADGRR
jgi:hypothetical protein